MQRWFVPLWLILTLAWSGCNQPTADAAQEASVITIPAPDGCASTPVISQRRDGAVLSGASSLRAGGISARLAPSKGSYFGVNLDWANDTPAGYSRRLGHSPAVYVQFLHFPLDTEGRKILMQSARLVANQHAMLLITLEPWQGLDTVDAQSIQTLTQDVHAMNQLGVGVMVRFAHEMNGSWYPWSQQSDAYIRVFRAMANALHQGAPQTVMLWAPNYGGGYPFAGGQFQARPGSPDFHLLDSNRDGRLDMHDDPYAPYYPGDDAVDWAGMSLYHWGASHPWGENTPPETGKFIEQLTGAYRGPKNDCAVPDFYRQYAVLRGKPIAIAETAALYNADRPGLDELRIKQAWWQQVFSVDLLEAYPALRMVNWFEWSKHEPKIQNEVIDWGVTRNPELRAHFTAHLTRLPLQFAPAP
ncbi:MAG: hypothetical protein EXR52_06275 [Dehalococcoidia bacterium]|nr:hypothetical protein [Dehalococcoidia bacterium]